MNEESLFHEALARTNPRERAKYLAKACAGRPELRAAVEALLGAHDQSGQFLQTPAVAVLQDIGAPVAVPPLPEGAAGPTQETDNRAGLTDPDSRRIGQETLDAVDADPDHRPAIRETLDFVQPRDAPVATPAEKVPERIGRYHIKKLLGRGGMGTVYLAHHPDLDRPVALKVPKLSGLDAEERFLREARAAAALSHPNLCPVHDAGRADGVLYLAMAYVPGPTLTDVIRQQGPLEPAQAAAIAIGVARGIAEAHRHGIVHRDLKPGNILLSRQGEPIVTDFGLALRASVPDVTFDGSPTPGHDPRLTLAGVLMGTPAYMPPEQARGDLARIGPASDVYALGAILFELLTGRQPFEASSVHELVRQIETKPTPSLAGIRPGIPGGLEAVCRRALAKNPADRFASMDAFANALAPFAKEQKHRYRRGIAIAAAAAFILMLAGGIVFYVQTNNGTIEIRVNDPTADVQVTVDGEEIKLTENGRVTRLRAGEHALVVKGPDYETETRLFKVKRGPNDVLEVELKPRAIAVGKPGLDFATQARLASILGRGRQLIGLGQYGELGAIAEQALKIDPESPSALAMRATHRAALKDFAGARADVEAALKLNPEHYQALVVRGLLCSEEGLLTNRTALQDEAIADATVAIRLDPKSPIAWSNRAFSYLLKHEFRQAIADATKAIECADNRPSPWQTRGAAHLALGEHPKALTDYTRAAELAPAVAKPRMQLAALYAKMGDAEKSAAEWAKARTLDPSLTDDSRIVFPDAPPTPERKKLTPEESSQLTTALNTAQRAWDLVQDDACARALTEALRIDPTSATAWSLKARLSTLNGNRADAIAEATEAIRLDSSNVWAYVARGAAREKTGELAAAIADNVVALRLDPKHHWGWNNRGYAYVRRGQFHQGLADLNEAVRLRPDSAEKLTNRGQCLLHLGDLTSALADYAKAVELQPSVGRWRLVCAAIRAAQNDLAGARRDRERALALDPQLANADGITLPVPLPPVKKDPELPLTDTADAPRVKADQERLARILARGRKMLDKGRLEEAGKAADDALKIDPESPLGLALRATNRGAKGDLESAREDAEAALKLNPELREALIVRAIVNGENGKLDDAIADETVAIRIDPTHPRAWANRAKGYLARKDFHQAIADATKAIELGLGGPDTHLSRGGAYACLGEYDKALADYDASVKQTPNKWQIYDQRAAVHAKMGNAAKEAEDWKKAKELNPTLTIEDRIAIPDPPKPVDRKKLTVEETKRFKAALAAAEAAHAESRYDDCAKACDEAVRLDPTSAAVRSLRAASWLGQRRFQDAVDEATEAIRLDAGDGRAYRLRGTALSNLNNQAGAIADLSIAIRQDPTGVAAWNNRGWAYYLRGQYHQAVADNTEALRLEPEAAQAYVNRGISYVRLGEYANALADFEAAVRLQPTKGSWRQTCGVIKARLGDADGARKDLELAAKLDPRLAGAAPTLPPPLPPLKKDPELSTTPDTSPPPLDKARLASLLAHGRKLIDEGRFDRLKPIYEEALRMDAESPGGLALRATFRHVTAGDRQGARADVEAALRLNPETFQALMQRSALIGPEGKVDDAIADLTIANRLQPKHPSPLASRAYGYVLKKEYRQAIADATRAIELGFMRPDALQARSGAYVNLGEYANALADYDALAQRTPSNPTVFVERSAVHAQLGNADKAGADWATARRLNPSLTENDRAAIPDPPKPPERKQLTPDESARLAAAMLKAQKAFANGRHEDCTKALDEACTLDPTSAAAHSLRARCFGDMGRTQEAIDEATEAIRLNPDDPWAYTARGNARNRLKDHAGAVADHVVAIRLDPANHAAWNNRGHAYFMNGQPHQGLADLNESLRLKPDYGHAYSNRGACHLALGEHEKALADYLKAAEAQPGNAQWRRICAALYARLGKFDEASKQREIVAKIDANLRGAPDVKLPVPSPVKQDPE